MEVSDVKKLYEAFTKLCDYVEQETENGCLDCPLHHVCYGTEGDSFAETIHKLQKEFYVLKLNVNKETKHILVNPK